MDLGVALGLARIASLDPASLGMEAGRARDWLGASWTTGLRREGSGTLLVRSDGATLEVSPELAAALDRFAQFLKAGERARETPIGPDELRAACLSTEAVARVAEIFERAIAERIRLDDGRLLVPELGGEATLDGRLHLHVTEDPTRPLLREIALSASEPEAVGRLLTQHPLEAQLLDENGQLRSEVDLWTARIARGVPEDRRRKGWSAAIRSVLENASDSYVLHPRQQLDLIVSRDWAGRLVGAWHVHPPVLAPSGLLPGDVPSTDDLGVARATGQFLTIVFRPDGFDVHDLARVAAGSDDPTSAPRFEHRSEAWRARFEKLHREVNAQR